MKDLSPIKHDEDLITSKYLNNNMTKIIGGGYIAII